MSTMKEKNGQLPRVTESLPPHLDPTKSELAFEERQLPKLDREMKSESIKDRQRALNSLTEIAHSQEKAYQATKLGLLETVSNLLSEEDELCRELSSLILSILCNHNTGRQSCLKHKVVPRLATLFQDKSVRTRENVHKTLYLISDLIYGQLEIVNNNLIPTFIDLLKNEEDRVLTWIIRTLHKCLRVAADRGLDHNGLEELKLLLEKEDFDIIEYTLRSIAEITVPMRGKEKANADEELTPLIISFLTHEKAELRAAAACALGMISITTDGKKKTVQCGAIEPLCSMLDDSLTESRLNSLTTLTICAEVPQGRTHLLHHKLKDIKKLLNDRNALVQNAAETCVRVIEWMP